MASAVRLGAPARVRPGSGVMPALLLAGAAWLVLLIGQATGAAALLHHHTLISAGGPPLWLAAILFLGAWGVMVTAMMLPASLPAMRLASHDRLRPFLIAYGVAWTGFGLFAFAGDVGVHTLVHATPWLAERSWLISAGLLAVAGIYQLLPAKHRALDACRQPLAHRTSGFAVGLDHAIDCVASSWALMLVMFAAGFGGLAWMVILTVVMAYEALGRHGHRVASAFGLVLLALAAMTALGASAV
jgi:predicted metal-binding membrane protein